MARSSKKPARRRKRSPSLSNRRVDAFLREVGIRPRMIADDFWASLRSTYGDQADTFIGYVDRRRTTDKAEAIHQEDVAALYKLKNASLEFSIALTSQYVGRLYSSYLAVVASLGLDRQAKAVLDLGCDNGILTAFYATLFPEAKVLGVDRCHEAIACANMLKDRLELPNLTFVVADAFQEPAASVLPLQSWDVVVMTLCGYEELDRHPERTGRIAARFFDYLKPSGVGVVVEYPDSSLMPALEVYGGRCRKWWLAYEAFGGDESYVDVAEIEVRRDPVG